MDKARNLRCEAIRFSNPNKRPHMKNHSGGHKLFEKSKKGKVRSLSSVGKALLSCKMGCNDSEKEEKAHDPSSFSSSVITNTNKRFKVPKNFLTGCNGVHHASVPRKLRSAMRKRSHESMLLDSEKVNHNINGILESPKKDGIKKSKASVLVKQDIGQDWSKREGVPGPITKDEEEVAETLYAMAAMFPENGITDMKELDTESFPEKKSVLEDMKENDVNATFEASGIAQHASHCPEMSAREATKISFIHEKISQEKLDLPKRVEFEMASHSTTPMMARSDTSNKGLSHHDPKLCLAMGLNMSIQSQISHIERKPIRFEMAKDVNCKQEQNMFKDQKENGILPVAFTTSQGYVKSSSAIKAPGWLEAAISASKQDLMESCSSSGKTCEVVNHKRPWKRCATHVHISHIIRSLEFPKRMIFENECHQMKAHDKGSTHVMQSGVTFASGASQFIETLRNPPTQYSDISQAALATLEMYGPQKQNFNFLSLSTGSNGLKVDNSYDKIGTRLEALSKLQGPHFHSVPQHHGLISIPTTQSQYASTSYLDHLSVPGPQIRFYQPQYYGNNPSSYGTHHNSTVISNKHQHQHHQSFWAVQLQGKATVNCNVTSYHDWKNGRPHYASSPCTQAILPRSNSSAIEAGLKIASISRQQQHQLISDFHLPSM